MIPNKTMYTEIENLTYLVTRLSRVYRSISKYKSSDPESTLEHSYHLAFVALYAAKQYAPSLDPYKVVMLALLHDWVEIYAGDSCSISSNPANEQHQEDLERAALIKLKFDLKGFPELYELISEYEQGLSDEARFVKFWDKLVPFWLDISNDMRDTVKKGVTFSHLKKNRESAIAGLWFKGKGILIYMLNQSKRFLQ